MKGGILTGERCPQCRIRADHPENEFERLALDELLGQDASGGFYRAVRLWLECAVCEHVWSIISYADRIDTDRAVAWLRSHPYQQLPKSCPR
jgi:hypothetical protein